METPFYLEYLTAFFEQQKASSTKFTLRDFGAYLDIDSASLSSIMRGKRPFPIAKIDHACEKLSLSNTQRKEFIDSIIDLKNRNKAQKHKEHVEEIILNEDDSYQFISQLDYSSALSLLKLYRRNISVEEMAQKLGISYNIAGRIMDRLATWKISDYYLRDHYEQKVIRLTTTQDQKSEALKESHRQGLDLAKEKMEEIGIMQRDFSSLTLAVNTQKLDKAKKLIKRFRKEMDLLLEDGDEDQVYYLGVQFFPVSELCPRK